jgi:branched-chain amino acid transport system permease protein
MKSASLRPLWQLIGFALLTALLYGVQRVLFADVKPVVNPYLQSIVINAGIAVILAVSLNLINGITGQFSLGHAGFMAVGAYVAAYFTKEIGGQLLDPINFSIGILLGALAAGAAGLVVGLPSLRLRGDYLAIVTLGFNQIIVSLIRNIEVVGGASGYVGIPKFTTFAWVFALAALCIGSIRNLASSALGRSMRAVRDDEIAAEASGINTTRVKVIAFVYSAMWAGVAGALQAHFIQYANPRDFNFIRSVEIVVMVVLGGLGSITGSALSAVGLTVLQEQLREVPIAFYTLVALVFVAFYWNMARLRSEKRGDAASLARAVIVPLALLALMFAVYLTPASRAFLEDNKGALRYVIYSLILIVVMLLRPQGLLGRSEWSFAALRRSKRIAPDPEGGLA